MADKQLTTEEKKRLEAWVLRQGYPDMETYRLEDELVKLGAALRAGNESVRDAYDRLLSDMLARGWTPYLLDGQQEIMVGKELSLEMYEKYKTYQAISE